MILLSMYGCIYALFYKLNCTYVMYCSTILYTLRKLCVVILCRSLSITLSNNNCMLRFLNHNFSIMHLVHTTCTVYQYILNASINLLASCCVAHNLVVVYMPYIVLQKHHTHTCKELSRLVSLLLKDTVCMQ